MRLTRTNASALARWRAGNDSDTSAAPVAHSPPIPSPSSTRNTASCRAVCANPHAAVKIE